MQLSGETDQGYYFLAGATVYFCDRNSDQWIVLCNRPDCTHSGSQCNGFFNGNKLYIFENKIYSLGSLQETAADYSHSIIRMNLDGTDHESIYRLSDTILGPKASGGMLSYYFHQGYLIVSINSEDFDQKTSRSRLLLISLSQPGKDPALVVDQTGDDLVRFRSAAGDCIYYFIGEKSYAWSISEGKSIATVDQFVPAMDEHPITGKYYGEKSLIQGRYQLGIFSINLQNGERQLLCNPGAIADGQDGIWYTDGEYIYLTNALMPLQGSFERNLHIFDLAGKMVQSLPVDLDLQGYSAGLHTDASDRVFWVSSQSHSGLPDWYFNKSDIGTAELAWFRMEAG
jgi:hypothetical protein